MQRLVVNILFQEMMDHHNQEEEQASQSNVKVIAARSKAKAKPQKKRTC